MLHQVSFLIPYGYGNGGIPRTVFIVAEELARRGHDVEVVSLTRGTNDPFFPLSDRVRIRGLMDLRHPTQPGRSIGRPRKRPHAPEELRTLDSTPSELAPGAHHVFSALMDRYIKEYLRSVRGGIVVTTRPELAVAAQRWTRRGVTTVLQEHNSFTVRQKSLIDAVCRATTPVKGRPLDALLTLTPGELERWRGVLPPDAPTRLGVIPNATPFTVGAPAPLADQRVIAVGRLVSQKGFERLVAAWELVAKDHPEWRLDIFGEGKQEKRLRQQIETAGLTERVRLAGVTTDVEAELRASSIFAMSSRNEGMPMVLLEAMSVGVPPVSFDCPSGPRELIDDGHNGVLVPEGDVPALAGALGRLIGDAELRRTLGANALASAAERSIDGVTTQWEALFDDLVEARRAGSGPLTRLLRPRAGARPVSGVRG